LIDLGQNREAIDCFRELLELFPESSNSHYNLANLLQDIGNFAAAGVHYRRALALDPDHAAARENLGRSLTDVGHLEEARQVWKSWLEHDPSSAVARHMLASISGENTPDRCADDYIRETFDAAFAAHYEHQLARLQYNPRLVGEAFEAWGQQATHLDVLDAGCGTGLCAPIFRPVARRLVGVDLSNDMLVEARKRELYDEAIACEITEYMRAHASTFDLIVAADTLCYFGELSEVLSAAFGCLRENGVLIFTVEHNTTIQDRGYVLQSHGRYCHSEQYVTNTLRDLGFTIPAVTHAVMRQERGVAVNGLVVTAVRSS
jgi:predicted TPR repeat methyltransferase